MKELKDAVRNQLKKNIENCTILIPNGKSYCQRNRSTNGLDPRFKVSSEGLLTDMDILIRSTIQVQTEADVA